MSIHSSLSSKACKVVPTLRELLGLRLRLSALTRNASLSKLDGRTAKLRTVDSRSDMDHASPQLPLDGQTKSALLTAAQMLQNATLPRGREIVANARQCVASRKLQWKQHSVSMPVEDAILRWSFVWAAQATVQLERIWLEQLID